MLHHRTHFVHNLSHVAQRGCAAQNRRSAELQQLPQLFESRETSPNTIRVSAFNDSGISHSPSAPANRLDSTPTDFSNCCEILAAICPSTAIRSRSANSLSSRNFSSINRHKSMDAGQLLA